MGRKRTRLGRDVKGFAMGSGAGLVIGAAITAPGGPAVMIPGAIAGGFGLGGLGAGIGSIRRRKGRSKK